MTDDHPTPEMLGRLLAGASSSDEWPRRASPRFDRLVDQVMSQAPYRHARRVFWIVDNGSSHRGQRSFDRLQRLYPHLVLVHGPTHASWLNQVEIYFSILQRKVLTPNDFASLADLAQRLHDFEGHYAALARPFEWTFTRQDLDNLLDRMKMAA